MVPEFKPRKVVEEKKGRKRHMTEVVAKLPKPGLRSKRMTAVVHKAKKKKKEGPSKPAKSHTGEKSSRRISATSSI